MNEVLETEPFSEAFKSFEKEEQKWIERMKMQLEHNLRTGKPLRYPWFREKKFLNKRLYYVVNFATKKAVFVTFAEKKQQQDVINEVIANKERYFRIIQ